MKITRGYETFSAESIAEIHFVLEVSFLILRKQEAEMKEWYQISAEEVKKKMETSEHGLTTEEAAKRLAEHGVRSPQEVYLLSVDEQGQIFFVPKEAAGR